MAWYLFYMANGLEKGSILGKEYEPFHVLYRQHRSEFLNTYFHLLKSGIGIG